MNNELNKEDYELLLTLINNSKTIFKIYIELAKLEIIGKKESEEFKENLEKLETYIKLEKGILNTISATKLYTMIEEVSKEISCNEEKHDIITLISQNKMDILPLERVSKQLRNQTLIIMGNPSKTENKTTNHFLNIFASSTELMKNLENDKYLLLIHLLEEKIKSTPQEEEKAKLIRTKYYFSYITSYIEENLIKNHFNTPENIFFSADLTAKLYKISPNVLEHSKASQGLDLYKEQLKTILKIKSSDYDKQELEIQIRESFLRTAFQFLTEEKIKKLNIEFQIFTENNNLVGFEKSIELIENAFKSYEKDKTLIKKVTLG